MFAFPTPVGPGKTGPWLWSCGALGRITSQLAPSSPNPRVPVAARCGKTWLLIHRRLIGDQPGDCAFVRTECSQEQLRAKCRGPGPAGMGFYTWAVLLPFH